MLSSTTPDHNGRRGISRIHPAAVLFWLLIIFAPFICAALLQFFTGSSVRQLDAWNTTWNDEVGYNRVVVLLRNEFTPRGMVGYNEAAPAHLPYGPYNIFTYLPYFVISFATGITTHNFIYYSNVILAVLACLLFVILVRPGVREGFYAAVFLAMYLVAGRYIWSGMSEGSYSFFLILFTALALWLMKNPQASSRGQGAALFAMILSVFFWNTMRPYYFPLLLVPLYLLLRKKSRLSVPAKILFVILIGLSAAGSLGLYFFFTNYNVAHYFTQNSPAQTLRALIGGPVTALIRQILSTNLQALREVLGYLRAGRWAGGITILYLFQSLLLLFLLIRSLLAREKARDGRCAVIFLMLLAGAAVYEANVVLYSPVQLHRMMLAVTLSYGLLLAVLGGWERLVSQIALIVLMAFLFVQAPGNFAFPQINEDTLSASQEADLKLTFRGILPLADDPWDNTIAKLVEESDMQWEFMLPTYASLNVCQAAYMQEHLTDGTLKSKFVLLPASSDLCDVCAKHGWPVVWEGYGRLMYQLRD